MMETIFNNQPDSFSGPDLLSHSLVDDHVRVNGHSEGKNDTGNTGEGEDCADGCQNAEKEEDVGEKRDVGHVTGSVIVE
jgi:hypothetical protein